MDVVGLLEDDRAERVVGQLELRDVDVDELEAGAGQALERLGDAGSHARTHVRILELSPQHADPQPVDRVQANRSVGEHAEKGRRLLDRARQRAHVVAGRREREHPLDGYETERRLESDDAAVRSRDANRATRVRAERQVADAGGDERRRAAARAPRRPAAVKRVEGHAVRRIDAARGVFEQVRLAKQLGTGHAQATDDGRVAFGRQR